MLGKSQLCYSLFRILYTPPDLTPMFKSKRPAARLEQDTVRVEQQSAARLEQNTVRVEQQDAIYAVMVAQVDKISHCVTPSGLHEDFVDVEGIFSTSCPLREQLIKEGQVSIKKILGGAAKYHVPLSRSVCSVEDRPFVKKVYASAREPTPVVSFVPFEFSVPEYQRFVSGCEDSKQFKSGTVRQHYAVRAAATKVRRDATRRVREPLAPIVVSERFVYVRKPKPLRDKVLPDYLKDPPVRSRGRHIRDMAQRHARAEFVEIKRKSEPKLSRLGRVKEERDKRSPLFTEEELDFDFSMLRLQSGLCGSVDEIDWGSVAFTAAGIAGTFGAGYGVAKLYAIIERILSKTEKAVDIGHSILDVFKSVRDQLKNFLGPIVWVVPALCILHWVWSNVSDKNRALFDVALLTISALVAAPLWAEVSIFFRRGEQLQLQAGGSGVIGKLLATAMSFAVFGEGGRNQTSEFIRRIGSIERVASGTDALVDWLTTALQVLIDYCNIHFSTPSFILRKEKDLQLVQWVKDVERHELNSANMKSPITPEQFQVYVNLSKIGHELRDLYRGADTTTVRLIQQTLVTNFNLMRPLSGGTSSGNFRMEPIMGLLLGSSGIGKTLVAETVCATILHLSGILSSNDMDSISSHIWQKGTSDYWNGYAGQECLVMDDAFQSRASPSDKDNDYINIIRMVGPWTFALNMADLESKGKFNFNAKFVFGTTNVASITSEAEKVIVSADAVARRIHYGYKMELKPEYSTSDRRLDYEKFTRERIECENYKTGIDRFPWHVWNIYKHDFYSGATSTEALSLKQMVIVISDALRERFSKHGEGRNRLTNFLDNLNNTQPILERVVNLQGGGNVFRTCLSKAWAATSLVSRVASKRVGTGLISSSEVFIKIYAGMKLDLANSKLWLRVSATLGIVLLAATLVGVVLKSFFNFLVHLFPPTVTKAKKQSNVLVRATPVKARHVAVQAGVNNDIANKIYRNVFKIIVKRPGVAYPVGQLLYVQGNMAVQPAHFREALLDKINIGEFSREDIVYFTNAVQQEKTFTVTLGAYLDAPAFQPRSNCDVEFVKLQPNRATLQIVSAFLTESDLQNIDGESGRLDVCSIDEKLNLVPEKKRFIHAFPDIKRGLLNQQGYRNDRVFIYKAQTIEGDCGSPMSITTNTSYQGRCLGGIHVAHDGKNGYASVVTREMVMKASAHFLEVNDHFMTDLRSTIAQCGVTVVDSDEQPFDEMGSFEAICQVSRPVVICPTTSYFKTEHFGKLGESGTSPVPLDRVWKEGGYVYPMANAVKPYSSPLLLYEQPWLKHVAYVAFKNIRVHIASKPKRLFTFEEAVLGIPELKFRSIPRATAAGFPFCYDLRDGKRAFFGSGAEYDLSNPLCGILKERVNFIISEAKANKRLAHVFVDFLKDELRSEAKVESVSARLISSAPLPYTIVWRMFFGAYQSACMREHTKTGMAPGICTYTEWHEVANFLRTKGERMFDGDFKTFDSSEQPVVHDLFLDHINDWYDDGEENALVRKVLWLDLVHSRHVGGKGKDQRHIYQWSHSLPSGHPFTTICNSMYSLFLMVASYHMSTKRFDFWEHSVTVVYGDDNVNSVDDEFSDLHNHITVRDNLKSGFNLTYTPGDKGSVPITTTTLEKIGFLKRRFVLEGGHWNCPLDVESFLFTIYWCKNKKLEKKIAVDVLEVALEELSMHSVELWERYAPNIASIQSEIGVESKAPLSREFYQNIIRSRSDSWF